MLFSPFSLLFLFLLLGLLLFLFIFIQIGVMSYAFERIGISENQLFSVLLLTLFGSFVNIPVYKIRTELEEPGQVIRVFGFRFIIPRPVRHQITTVAVNVGGALIPTVISLYLLLTHTEVFWQAVMATAVVTAVAKAIARPIRGLGIASPPFIAPITAAVLAYVLAPEHAPVVAYCAGTLGVLIGADLLNADKFDKLGAPVVSIGGAGTFDGIFFTGIFAVLLASF